MRRVQIHLLRGGDVVGIWELKDRPLQIGRGPANDIILADEQVSWHHASLWEEGGELRLRDLGSTNGTFLGGQRVSEATVEPGEALVRLGPATELRILARERTPAPPLRQLILEDLDAGLKIPLLSDRLVVGSAPSADLRLPSGPPRAFVLLIHGPSEIYLGRDLSERPLRLGEVFSGAERRFRVVEQDAQREPTLQATEDRYPYRLEVNLQGATGPEAAVFDLTSSRKVTFQAQNPAVLLYLLGRKLLEDREAGRPEEECGWCGDEEVMLGLWGQRGLQKAESQLHVLVFRLRQRLEQEGLDPWMIEKRRRFIRARLREVDARG